MSLSDNTYYELEALKESVQLMLKAYEFAMTDLYSKDRAKAEKFMQVMDAYLAELENLVGENETIQRHHQ